MAMIHCTSLSASVLFRGDHDKKYDRMKMSEMDYVEDGSEEENSGTTVKKLKESDL